MRSVEISWRGGSHEFALPIGMLRALQDRTDSGPVEVLMRLQSGAWKVDDLIAVIALGLEGAGMVRKDAALLVKNEIDDGAITELVLPALAVLSYALYGDPEDSLGEGMVGNQNNPNDGNSASSTETEPS